MYMVESLLKTYYEGSNALYCPASNGHFSAINSVKLVTNLLCFVKIFLLGFVRGFK